MSKIVLDFGSGNTCHNDSLYALRMIDEMAAVNKGNHTVIIKWQLFDKAGDNTPLKVTVFDEAYWYAKKLGYDTTASVFDRESLEFLATYKVPFVKIANNRELDWLIGHVPRMIPVYVSQSNIPYMTDWTKPDITSMACVSKYPATMAEYEANFYPFQLRAAVSDHTVGLDLWRKYQPDIIETHYKLEDSTGLDAGPFAKPRLNCGRS